MEVTAPHHIRRYKLLLPQPVAAYGIFIGMFTPPDNVRLVYGQVAKRIRRAHASQ